MLTWAIRQSLLAGDAHFLISRLRMQSQLSAVLIGLETWLFEAHLKDWHSLHTRVLSDFRMVLMYDTVESGRMQGIMSCVFGRVLQPIVLQICLAFSFFVFRGTRQSQQAWMQKGLDDDACTT